MTASPLLDVAGLNVRYGYVEAVRGISFSVAPGEILALIGANGAGKTSTLSALSGLTPATGRIAYRGTDISGLGAEKRSGLGIALTPEGRRVFPSLTVAENLLLGGAAHKGKHDPAAKREEMLSLFPILKERYHQRAGLLSGGEQQMLAIARSLMSAPDLLLLDEPSLGLAPQIVDQVFELIVKLNGTGLTILLVEQNASRALEIAHHALVLANGAVALSGKASDLLASPEIRAAYLSA